MQMTKEKCRAVIISINRERSPNWKKNDNKGRAGFKRRQPMQPLLGRNHKVIENRIFDLKTVVVKENYILRGLKIIILVIYN